MHTNFEFPALPMLALQLIYQLPLSLGESNIRSDGCYVWLVSGIKKEKHTWDNFFNDSRATEVDIY